MGNAASGDEDIALSYKWKMDPASRKWSRDDSAISNFSKSPKSQIVKRSCSTPVTYKQRHVSASSYFVMPLIPTGCLKKYGAESYYGLMNLPGSENHGPKNGPYFGLETCNALEPTSYVE